MFESTNYSKVCIIPIAMALQAVLSILYLSMFLSLKQNLIQFL